MSKTYRPAIAFALATLTTTYAFGQTPIRHTVINCVKVKDGKTAEFRAYLNDIAVKLYKSRVEAGEATAYVIAAAVSPTGTSARCDYHLVATYNGVPAELNVPGKLDADLKRAGINLTADQLTAKRDSLSALVSRHIWRTRDSVGAGAQKGGYVRANYYKVHPGKQAEYLTAETTGWKLLAEELNKQSAGRTWSVYTLVMPGGEELAYNAMTVDGFPNWDSLMTTSPMRALWNKVHPTLDSTAYFNHVNNISDRPFLDVLRIVEAIRK